MYNKYLFKPLLGDDGTSRLIFIAIPKSGSQFIEYEFIPNNISDISFYSHSRCISNSLMEKINNHNFN
jgi:hypothetical protein